MNFEHAMVAFGLISILAIVATLGWAIHLWREVAIMSPSNTIQNISWPTEEKPRVHPSFARCIDDRPGDQFELSQVYMDKGKTWFFVDRYLLEDDAFVSCQTFSSTDGVHWFNTAGGREPNEIADEELCTAFEESVRSGNPARIGRPFDRRRGV